MTQKQTTFREFRKYTTLLIRQYLNREIIHLMIAITIILLVIVMSNMFVHYLSFTANGKLIGINILSLIGTMTPKYIMYIIPSAFFIALISAIGKLFANNELIAAFACGLTWRRILKNLILPTIILFLLETILSLYVVPIMIQKQKFMQTSAQNLSPINFIQPGQITTIQDGQTTFYVQNSAPDNLMHNIFIFQKQKDGSTVILTAPTGHLETQNDNQYLILNNGHYVKGVIGEKALEKGDFQTSKAFIQKNSSSTIPSTYTTMPFLDLWHNSSMQASAEIQSRLSFPFSVIIALLLGLALSYLKPRSARYTNTLPSLLIFILYFNLFSISKNWIADGTIPFWIGTFWVQILFAAFAIYRLFQMDYNSIRITSCWRKQS